MLKVIQYLIKISNGKNSNNSGSNEQDAETLLAVVSEEDDSTSTTNNNLEQKDISDFNEIEQRSEEYVALWNCAQNLLMNFSNQDDDDVKKEKNEICLSLLRLCTFFAVSCGGVEQKSITLRALARAELLFATSSSSQQNNNNSHNGRFRSSSESFR